MFANGDNPSQIYSFFVQSPILSLAMPIFPTKVATVEAPQSSMRQCGSWAHPFAIAQSCHSFQNILTLQLNIQLEYMIVP